jgi:integrase
MFCVCRNGWFHFKIRVPCDLIAVVGKSVIQYPLRVRKKREANRLALELRDRLTPQFQRLRIERLTGAKDEQLSSLAIELLPLGQTFRTPTYGKLSLTLSELIDAYLKDRSKNIDDRTILNMRYTFDLFSWILGHDEIGSISRLKCRACRDLMLKLPVRALSYSGKLSPDEVIGLNKPPMNPKTVNKNIQFLSALFKWAVNEELMDNNPVRNLSIKLKQKASLERKAYDTNCLKRLFSNIHYSEDESEDYWLPVLGYYTGMRVEELCQLRIKDIELINDVYCIMVSPDAGSLKTVNAERIIPVHSELIRLGFIEYWKSIRSLKDTERLWKNLKPNSYGKFSSAYSKRFGRLKRKLGIVDPLLTFHSFRHTFVNELKQQGVSEHVIAQLIGHANSSITMGRYGKDYDVEVLSSAVEQLIVATRVA